MKTKYFLIYVAVGAAFLAVSLWLMLFRGHHPKAVRAKYKLGGVMLLCWTMIATASCEKGPLSTSGIDDEGEIMCYEPVIQNDIFVTTERRDNAGFSLFSEGETLTISIESPSQKEFFIGIYKWYPDKPANQRRGSLLQSEKMVLEGDNYLNEYKLTYHPEHPGYQGQAEIAIYLQEDQLEIGKWSIFSSSDFIITAGED